MTKTFFCFLNNFVLQYPVWSRDLFSLSSVSPHWCWKPRNNLPLVCLLLPLADIGTASAHHCFVYGRHTTSDSHAGPRRNKLEGRISHRSGVVTVTQIRLVTVISLHNAPQAHGYISGGSATELAFQRGFTICLTFCAPFEYLFSVTVRIKLLGVHQFSFWHLTHLRWLMCLSIVLYKDLNLCFPSYA